MPVSGSKTGLKNWLSDLFHSLENKDVEELYQFVEKGTEVEIIR
ncbi:L,D-transpeptidase [Microcoleus sp. S13_D1]